MGTVWFGVSGKKFGYPILGTDRLDEKAVTENVGALAVRLGSWLETYNRTVPKICEPTNRCYSKFEQHLSNIC